MFEEKRTYTEQWGVNIREITGDPKMFSKKRKEKKDLNLRAPIYVWAEFCGRCWRKEPARFWPGGDKAVVFRYYKNSEQKGEGAKKGERKWNWMSASCIRNFTCSVFKVQVEIQAMSPQAWAWALPSLHASLLAMNSLFSCQENKDIGFRV